MVFIRCRTQSAGQEVLCISQCLVLQMYVRQFREMAEKRLIPDYEAHEKPLGGPVKVAGEGTPAMPGAESASIE